MMENNTVVPFDVVSRLEIEIQDAAKLYEGKYELDEEAHERALDVYRCLRWIADQNGGAVEWANIIDFERITFQAEVASVDLYKESLEKFLDLLGKIDHIYVLSSKEDIVTIEVSVNGLWKAV